jgi:glycosyltransferase involved in cell wall biosynthesis
VTDNAIPRRLLVVSYVHPPAPGIGGVRWEAMARHLRAMGHSVTVVASNAWGALPDDAVGGVVRVTDLRTSPVLRRVLRRGTLRVAGDAGALERPPQALLTKVLVPEMNVLTWLPAVATAVRRRLARERFDCLVTTSPPESSHLVGLLLGKSRPAWVADFRDGWTFEPWRGLFPTAAQRRLDSWLERRVVQTADVAVGATEPIADDLARRLAARAAWVPNGWDPASEPEAALAPRRRPKFVQLVYTGTLTVRGDPGPFLHALQIVNEELGGRPIRLIHAGRLTTEERALIDDTGIADAVEHLGTLDRTASIALQRSADALLLLTSRNRSEATGKLFEYLAAGRPIVALAEGNEAARIVRETNTGVTVPPDDVEAIAGALRRVASGELEKLYAPRNLERYTYPSPAEAMAELVETAIRRRAES